MNGPAASNPFATRFIRPGALPFLFPPDLPAPDRLARGIDAGPADQPLPDAGAGRLEDLLVRWRSAGRVGQIVGPHGSGKSTLLAALTQALVRAGLRVESHTLRPGEPGWPRLRRAARRWDRQTAVAVDGLEQLSWHRRWHLRQVCRRRGCGLLATTHRPLGWPLLWETRVTPELARAIVARLAPGYALPDGDRLEQLLADQAGNMRETLFALYDLYQQGQLGRSVPAVSPDDSST
jgi:hypothetical protein